MKPLIYISILALLIANCKDKSANTAKSHKRSVTNTSNDNTTNSNYLAGADTVVSVGCLTKPYIHGSYDEEQFSPGTFNKTTYIYSSTKPNAKIIDTLPFNVPVNILKEYPEFYMVCTNKAKSGFIKKTDLYLNKMFGSWDSNTFYYLVGITKYPPKANLDVNPVTCENSTLKMVKISYASGEILNVYTDTIMGANYNIKPINILALKNAHAIFRISFGCMQDIETDAQTYVIDNGKKISTLIKTSLSGDGGYGDGNVVYLPVKLENGKKIVFAKEGVLSIDHGTAKPDILEYPDNCGIPIDELVIVQNWSEESNDDEKPQYNSDGTAISTITITATTYYRWDGNKLTKVKTIKGR